jgi:hypothetical protein
VRSHENGARLRLIAPCWSASAGSTRAAKGYLAAKIADRLQIEGLKVALIGGNDWLNLPDVCDNCAGHFYEHAMRFDEMFERLIIPLKQRREISAIADCADAKAKTYCKRRYDFCEIDIICRRISPSG